MQLLGTKGSIQATDTHLKDNIFVPSMLSIERLWTFRLLHLSLAFTRSLRYLAQYDSMNTKLVMTLLGPAMRHVITHFTTAA